MIPLAPIFIVPTNFIVEANIIISTIIIRAALNSSPSNDGESTF